jgi:hypothetical protein
MKLITMVEVSNADEEDEDKIAKLLTVSLSLIACSSLSFEANDQDIVYHLSYPRIYGGGQFASQCGSHRKLKDWKTKPQSMIRCWTL